MVLVGLALDTDGDGLGDSLEAVLGTNPLDADSDDDGLTDGAEDASHNGAIDGAESGPNNAAFTPQAVQKVSFIPGLALVLLACVLTVVMARRQRG